MGTKRGQKRSACAFLSAAFHSRPTTPPLAASACTGSVRVIKPGASARGRGGGEKGAARHNKARDGATVGVAPSPPPRAPGSPRRWWGARAQSLAAAPRPSSYSRVRHDVQKQREKKRRTRAEVKGWTRPGVLPAGRGGWVERGWVVKRERLRRGVAGGQGEREAREKSVEWGSARQPFGMIPYSFTATRRFLLVRRPTPRASKTTQQQHEHASIYV